MKDKARFRVLCVGVSNGREKLELAKGQGFVVLAGGIEEVRKIAAHLLDTVDITAESVDD